METRVWSAAWPQPLALFRGSHCVLGPSDTVKPVTVIPLSRLTWLGGQRAELILGVEVLQSSSDRKL